MTADAARQEKVKAKALRETVASSASLEWTRSCSGKAGNLPAFKDVRDQDTLMEGTAPEGWIRPQKTCLIAAIPRCGSTILCSKMYDTRRLGCPDEYLNHVTAGFFHPGTAFDLETKLRLALEDGATSNGVFAMKLMPEHRYELLSAYSFEALFGCSSWIWVRRGDTLAQAISWEIADQTGQWQKNQRRLAEPVYSDEAILARLQRISAEDIGWEEFFIANNIQPLVLWYESIDKSPYDAVKQVARFMGVKLRPRVLNTAMGFYKYVHSLYGIPHFQRIARQRNELNVEWRRRYLSSDIAMHPPNRMLLRDETSTTSASSRSEIALSLGASSGSQ